MAGPQNIVILIPDTPTFEAFAESVSEKVFCRMVNHLETMVDNKQKGERWLTAVEAKKIIPFSSKKKWKILRDNLEVEFSQPGREFLYLESSLQDYLKNHSTIKNKKSKK